MHPANRHRLAPPAQKLFAQFAPPGFQPLDQFADRLPTHSRRSLVGFHLAARAEQNRPRKAGRHSADDSKNSSCLAEPCDLLAPMNFMLCCRLNEFGPSSRGRIPMASADFCIPIRTPRGERSPLADMQIPQNMTYRFPWVQTGFTAEAPDEIPGVSIHCRLSHLVDHLSGFCSSCPRFVSGFLRIPPRGNALALDYPISLHHGSLGTFIPATSHV